MNFYLDLFQPQITFHPSVIEEQQSVASELPIGTLLREQTKNSKAGLLCLIRDLEMAYT